ncbi:MAG: LysE family translocator [Sphingomonadaceae bacterium]|nr:LysE family translocator [Sphingomonadaceae bacterium]
MFDAERLLAFTLVTAMTSLVPGPSMLFVLSQSIWRGAWSGMAALMGLQLGYLFWWLLAALGLGTLAKEWPVAFYLLAIGGALYLIWLGVSALRHSTHPQDDMARPAHQPSTHAFRDGITVAIGNPKSLVYMVAIIPPFIDPALPVGWQIATLALVAAIIDLMLGGIYIGAGKGLAAAMARPATRAWLDRGVGVIFLAIALGILAELWFHGPQ